MFEEAIGAFSRERCGDPGAYARPFPKTDALKAR